MPITKFEPNVGVQVKLKYPSGKHVTSAQYGTEQVMYSLIDGNVMYVPLIVEKQLQELQVKAGQAIEIVKAQSKGKTEWTAKLVNGAKPLGEAQPAAKLLNGAPPLDGEYTDDPALQTQLENALKTALHAAKRAEEYSVTIQHPVQFDKTDIRLMAQTLVINSRRQAA